ncbi:MAG: NAD(P)-dependent oxidoreductase [Actinobacteria bacterium]|nr:NAD(P)-dependent oxidoreductase [Actinomycetota bacterium]
MGHPMSGHIARAGYALTVFDADPSACARVVAQHPAVAVAADPAGVGAVSDVVITMLPDGQQVQAVALGPGGLVETMQPGSLLLDTSSAQPWLTLATAAALAERGVDMIDAPVSGAQWGAEEGNLVFMAGADATSLERVRPILDLLGRAVHHCGPLGSGHIMKCINNTITAMTFLATAEGLALGVRAGLDPVAMNGVLNDSTGGSWISANHIGQRILSRTFDDPFRLELMLKDITIACDLARQLGLDLPYAQQCETTYQSAHEMAGPGASLSELARWVERATGVELVAGNVPDHGADPVHRI